MKKALKKVLPYKNIIARSLLAFVVLAALIFVIILFIRHENRAPAANQIQEKPFRGLVINDEIKIPEAQNIAVNAGEIVIPGDYAVKLQPASQEEEVLVVKAKLTLKEAYQAAEAAARAWSSDARLVFIRSNGAVSLDGQSSSWRLVFASARLDSGYDIIVIEDKIVSAQPVSADSSGYELPVNWYDSNEAIASLTAMPQFANSYLSALTFYYSAAAESWAYGLALADDKTVSMWVK